MFYALGLFLPFCFSGLGLAYRSLVLPLYTGLASHLTGLYAPALPCITQLKEPRQHQNKRTQTPRDKDKDTRIERDRSVMDRQPGITTITNTHPQVFAMDPCE